MNIYQYKDNLESARLKTRFLTSNDIEPWSDFFKDKESIEFFPNAIAGSYIESSKNWIDRQILRYTEKRYGLQALIHKDTREFIGLCGLLAQVVNGEPKIEVGYHVLKKHWGQGYAPEAAKLFINYAFMNNLTTSVISIIDIGNIKSQRVAEKNGLVKVKQTRYQDLDVFIYEINKKSCYYRHM
ncbi:MAG: GNAT family N-acetyltransferase [Cytophagaceae bacterium]|nr:GNAT family N-acetyltransferase [Cytophagaceae bacterium]